MSAGVSISMSASQGRTSLSIFDYYIKTLGNFYGFYF
ncbi:hypothetical protein TorRG33x02_231700 [Trema orientale]|uniref:Uncharacterized protein n=1 Tax=Trema orientale TaxID=63057 RepID=A0A2P5E683_TREOI|nr:hypothetical protein TorRG33x02_231700 [Trema orientale]